MLANDNSSRTDGKEDKGGLQSGCLLSLHQHAQLVLESRTFAEPVRGGGIKEVEKGGARFAQLEVDVYYLARSL